jgi:UrcA family protein
MQRRFIKFISPLAVLLCIAPTAFAAGSVESDSLPAIKVQYRTAELASPATAVGLYSRLEHAARTVCGDSDIRDLGRRQRWQHCVNKALADSLRQVHSATNSALPLEARNR